MEGLPNKDGAGATKAIVKLIRLAFRFKTNEYSWLKWCQWFLTSMIFPGKLKPSCSSPISTFSMAFE
jgi:hypothetical protein